ncbi:MAG TPA: hypothetical protein VGO66_13100 [Solirubrobacterales bacterium]|jgi:hypothetical protein|nr:hypothetical protein [Solirubrobacterales bacterium]
MYSRLWSPRLRQGDILGPAFLPTIGKSFETVIQESSLTGDTDAQRRRKVVIDGDYHYLTVISHCCEFNEGKRNKFLLARLKGVPGNLSDEEKRALRLSNDVAKRVAEDEDIAGVDAFVVEPIPGLFEAEQVVAFTTITAFPMSMRNDLAEVKKAELDHSTRVQFREKLAWFLGRAANDISDEEKELPPEPDEA